MKQTLQNLRGFKVEYLQPTDTKPARIKITDLRHGKSVLVNYSAHSANTGQERAIEYLEGLNIPITAQTWCEKNSVHQYTILLSTNFDTDLK